MKSLEELRIEQEEQSKLQLQDNIAEKRNQKLVEAFQSQNGINILPKLFIALFDRLFKKIENIKPSQVNISPNFKIPEIKVPEVKVNYTPPKVEPKINIEAPIVNVPETKVKIDSVPMWDELETKFNKAEDLVGIEEVYGKKKINYKKIAGRWYRD